METLVFVCKNLFPFKGYKLSVLECGKRVVIGMESRRKCGSCPECGKRCSRIESEYERTVRDMDMAGTPCYLRFKEKKIRCKCGYRGVEAMDFVTKSRRITRRMEAFIVSLCEKMSLKEVSEIVDIDWKTIKNIDLEHLKSLLPDFSKLRITRIAIDEIAIMKGQKYFTIIRDYDTGIAIKILFGRTYEETAAALASLGQERLAYIKFASLDMWDPYIKAIKEKCPNAELVFDKFHVVKKVNDALDAVRKKEFADAEKSERIQMKRKRFVILRRMKNLSKSQGEELGQLLQSNERLYKAYLLKEQVLSIFDDKNSTVEQIKDRFASWFVNIQSCGFQEFNVVVNTMQHYFYGILNHFRTGMTNSLAEGFNTKINIIKRRAYGFRDLEYFMLKIYQSSLRRLA
jgi:transposase